MGKIHQLSAHVVNKIAAGEVIERPASVVKELVENSLDAGATRVDVTLRQGGVELIRVADNGFGIAAEDIPLAIASHATSKIEGDEQLFSVRTLGFRGEALASIASVSRFRLESRTNENDSRHVLQVVGGTIEEGVLPCGGPVGTRIEVNDLFFNTPVRRKFLRTTSTELGHVTEAITRLALAFPQVHFVLRHQERTVYDLPATDSWRDRIAAFFGRELAEHLIWVDQYDEELQLEGFVADPSYTRANARLQYYFLNQRYIRDRSLQHALSEAYRGLIMTGRYPIAFLRLEMPPHLVDVNVHPTKLEVRFQDGGKVYSRILGTLRNKFLTSNLTKSVPLDQNRSQDPRSSTFSPTATTGIPMAPAVPELPWDKHDSADARSAIRVWAEQLTPSVAHRGDAFPIAPVIDSGPVAAAAGIQVVSGTTRTDSPHSSVGAMHPFPPVGQPALETVAKTPVMTQTLGQTTQSPSASIADSRGASSEMGRAIDSKSSTIPIAPPVAGSAATTRRAMGLQIHDRYLVCESGEGLVVIDQHALHERILYEKLRERVGKGGLEQQQLLVPEPVELTGQEAAALLEARDMLNNLGVGIEDFGGATVVVNSYPAMLRHFRPDQLLKELAELLLTGKKQLAQEDVLDQLLHTMACKAAVKAGDRLTPDEVTALLDQRGLIQDWHHCPHGRPTTLVFKQSELDRYFGRI